MPQVTQAMKKAKYNHGEQSDGLRGSGAPSKVEAYSRGGCCALRQGPRGEVHEGLSLNPRCWESSAYAKTEASNSRLKHETVTIKATLATQHCAGCIHKERARAASVARAYGILGASRARNTRIARAQSIRTGRVGLANHVSPHAEIVWPRALAERRNGMYICRITDKGRHCIVRSVP